MPNPRQCLFGGALCAAGLVPAITAHAEPSGRFVPLEGVAYTANCLSPDGQTVGGHAQGGVYEFYGALWSRDGLMQGLYIGRDQRTNILAVSNGAEVISGWSEAYHSLWGHERFAAIWETDPYAFSIAGPRTEDTNAFIDELSADGSVKCGVEHGLEADNYDSVSYPILIGLNLSFPESYELHRPRAISHAGDALVGTLVNLATDGTVPFLWREGAGVTMPNFPGLLSEISGDGRLVLCDYQLEPGIVHYCLWNEDTGIAAVVPPPVEDPARPYFARDLNADGSVVVGRYTTPSTALADRGFVWTPCDGSRALNGWLADRGVEVPDGWKLGEATGVSADGTVIVGNGLNPDGQAQPYIIDLYAERASDCDANGVRNINDIECFVDAFLSAQPAGDCDEDGDHDVNDIACFVAGFLNACG
ncbi:MAG: hypothetical protein DHS20C14_22790 [Phycisphaeraceae bacterium]|nr:MAG: hypothetical protein DHS20C14_22790 [Phycisphaeraceae bacterium]